MTTVVAMCGVAGSGKTTYATRLEAQGYVRLSIDEEVWSTAGRFGVDYEPAQYTELSRAAEARLRDRLVRLVGEGCDVVLDLSFWQRATRDDYRHLVEGLGATWRLVYLRVDRAELRRRLALRAARFDANAAFAVTDELLDTYLAGFEEPHGEGEQLS